MISNQNQSSQISISHYYYYYYHLLFISIDNQMAEGLFDIGVNECLLSLDAVLSLAIPLSFESSYFVHCKEMLVRRQVALQALLTANQSLDKAKPEKKDFVNIFYYYYYLLFLLKVEQVKVKAEGEFHSLSRVAEKEVRHKEMFCCFL